MECASCGTSTRAQTRSSVVERARGRLSLQIKVAPIDVGLVALAAEDALRGRPDLDAIDVAGGEVGPSDRLGLLVRHVLRGKVQVERGLGTIGIGLLQGEMPSRWARQIIIIKGRFSALISPPPAKKKKPQT